MSHPLVIPQKAQWRRPYGPLQTGKGGAWPIFKKLYREQQNNWHTEGVYSPKSLIHYSERWPVTPYIVPVSIPCVPIPPICVPVHFSPFPGPLSLSLSKLLKRKKKVLREANARERPLGASGLSRNGLMCASSSVEKSITGTQLAHIKCLILFIFSSGKAQLGRVPVCAPRPQKNQGVFHA